MNLELLSALYHKSEEIELEFCRSKQLNFDCIRYPLYKIRYQVWTHVCATYDTELVANNYETKMTIYLDGTKLSTSKHHRA